MRIHPHHTPHTPTYSKHIHTQHVSLTNSILNCPVSPTFSQFKILQELGEGNFSEVVKAIFIPTNELVALKIIEKKKAERISVRHGNLKSELRAERRILTKLNHVNIIKLFHTFQDANNIYYVEEFCSGRELWFKLRVNPPACLKKEWPAESRLWGLCGLRPSLGKFYLAQILNALAYLHSQGIVHRDLKPENVMIAVEPSPPATASTNPDPSNQPETRFARIKLIDFGTARDLFDAEDDKVPDDDKKQDEDDDDSENPRPGRLQKAKKTHFVGTPEFMSPEAIHGKPADHRSDLWSFGCTAFQVFSGRTPFKGGSDYLTFLKAEASHYSVPRHLEDSPYHDMLRCVLKMDANDRVANAGELKKHPFFEGIDFDDLENPQHMPLVPLPTAEEVTVQRLGEAIWVECEARGEGPLSRYTYKEDRSGINVPRKRRVFEGSEARDRMKLETLYVRLDAGLKLQISGWLEQRSTLSAPYALQCLYGLEERKQAPRVFAHTFLGYSQQEEGYYSQPFLFAVVETSAQAKTTQRLELLERLAASKPRPRVLFFGGPDEDFDPTFSVKDTIPCALVATKTSKFREFYSLWIGGVLFIVLDAFSLDLDESQRGWFERELLLGKFCARLVVVVSSKRFISCSAPSCLKALKDTAGDEGDLFSLETRARFLRQMQESNVHLILRIGGGARHKFVITKTEPNEPDMIQVETPALPDMCRIVRALPTSMETDSYALNELTGFFTLEDDAGANSDDKAGTAGGGQERKAGGAFDSSSDDE